MILVISQWLLSHWFDPVFFELLYSLSYFLSKGQMQLLSDFTDFRTYLKGTINVIR